MVKRLLASRSFCNKWIDEVWDTGRKTGNSSFTDRRIIDELSDIRCQQFGGNKRRTYSDIDRRIRSTDSSFIHPWSAPTKRRYVCGLVDAGQCWYERDYVKRVNTLPERAGETLRQSCSTKSTPVSWTANSPEGHLEQFSLKFSASNLFQDIRMQQDSALTSNWTLHDFGLVR